MSRAILESSGNFELLIRIVEYVLSEIFFVLVTAFLFPFLPQITGSVDVLTIFHGASFRIFFACCTMFGLVILWRWRGFLFVCYKLCCYLYSQFQVRFCFDSLSFFSCAVNGEIGSFVAQWRTVVYLRIKVWLQSLTDSTHLSWSIDRSFKLNCSVFRFTFVRYATNLFVSSRLGGTDILREIESTVRKKC